MHVWPHPKVGVTYSCAAIGGNMFSTPKGPKHSSGLTGLSSPHFTPSGRRSIQNTPRHTPSIINKWVLKHLILSLLKYLNSRTFRAEQILEETLLHVLKAKNSPVPVQVQEVLRNNINSMYFNIHYDETMPLLSMCLGSSIKLHDSGWAWLVSGHKAYLWKHSLQQATVSDMLEVYLWVERFLKLDQILVLHSQTQHPTTKEGSCQPTIPVFIKSLARFFGYL